MILHWRVQKNIFDFLYLGLERSLEREERNKGFFLCQTWQFSPKHWINEKSAPYICFILANFLLLKSETTSIKHRINHFSGVINHGSLQCHHQLLGNKLYIVFIRDFFLKRLINDQQPLFSFVTKQTETRAASEGFESKLSAHNPPNLSTFLNKLNYRFICLSIFMRQGALLFPIILFTRQINQITFLNNMSISAIIGTKQSDNFARKGTCPPYFTK